MDLAKKYSLTGPGGAPYHMMPFLQERLQACLDMAMEKRALKNYIELQEHAEKLIASAVRRYKSRA